MVEYCQNLSEFLTGRPTNINEFFKFFNDLFPKIEPNFCPPNKYLDRSDDDMN